MNKMNTAARSAVMAAVGVMSWLSVTSHATTFDIDMVTVGNAGNGADTTGYGAVSYSFQIAKHEVTIGMYMRFLNAVAKSDP